MISPYLAPALERTYRQHPLVLADVGARGGLQAPWKDLQDDIRVLEFEPDARALTELQSQPHNGRTTIGVGLHAEQGRKPLYVTVDAGGTSLLQPNAELLALFPHPERFSVVKESEIEVDTLDHQLLEHGVSDLDFIKADTQGSELYVLQGARESLLRFALGAEVEVEFMELYRNQPLFTDVHTLLSGLGFELMDLRPVYWKRAAGKALGGPKGQLSWGDALYFRRLETLPALLQGLRSEDEIRAKCLKAMTVSAVFGYYDRALAVLETTTEHFDNSERSALSGALRAAGTADPVPDFRGRRRLARVLYRLWRYIEPKRQVWEMLGSGRKLGNLE